MRKKIYSLFIITVLLLSMTGCTGSESNNTGETPQNEDTKAINQEIANDDEFKASLIEIKKVSDEIWGNSIEIKFELENKSDQTVEVQAREVSFDGKMVDESMLSMSQEISSGKKADGVLTITEFEDAELPMMEENLEMILHVFSWDNMDYEKDYPLNLSFK